MSEESPLHLVVDAVPVREGSVTVVLSHLLDAWAAAWPGDRITVLAGPGGPEFVPPAGAETVALAPRLSGPAGEAWRRTVSVRRAARALRADALVAGVPASSLLGTSCPRGLILYDLRFELRPEQFSRRTRIARRLSWGWSMRRADRIFCISERTRQDLARRHPALLDRSTTALLGSDHVDSWPAPDRSPAPYALAFGHFANKNADAVLAGWARFCEQDHRWTLKVVGMGAADRAAAVRQVAALGIADRVELMQWLDEAAFVDAFSGAGLVVFPSDFEGFGLPAAEAQRLGIPVVISADPALAEVTGGHAVTARTTTPPDLAEAIAEAIELTPERLAAAQAHARAFTWHRTAEVIRDGLQ